MPIQRKLSVKNIEYLEIANGLVVLEHEVLKKYNKWGKKNKGIGALLRNLDVIIRKILSPRMFPSI